MAVINEPSCDSDYSVTRRLNDAKNKHDGQHLQLRLMVQGLLLVCRSMNENLVSKSTKIVALSFRLVLNAGGRKTVLPSCSQVGKETLMIPILEMKVRAASGLSLAF